MDKEFFEDLSKNIANVGQQALEKAKDVATITKKAAELHTEKQKLEECYARIGKRLYEATKDVPPQEDLIDFNEVEIRLSAIETLRQDIAILRGKGDGEDDKDEDFGDVDDVEADDAQEIDDLEDFDDMDDDQDVDVEAEAESEDE